MKSRLAVLVCLVVCAACSKRVGLPVAGSEQYQQLCAAFYLGLSALQSGEDVNARKGLTEATRIAPEEPAGWLNLSLLQFRQQDFEGAYQSASKGGALIGNDSRVEALLGAIESRRGKLPEAISHLERAVQLNSRNLKAAYALAQETERQNSPAADARAQELLERILSVEPNNIAVLIEDLRLAAKRGDTNRARKAIASLDNVSSSWPEAAKQQFKALQETVASSNIRAAAVQVQFLKNVLVRAPAYRQSLDEVRTPPTSAGEPFLRFFKLPSPRSEPDEPDRSLKFEQEQVPAAGSAAKWVSAVMLDGDTPPALLWSDGLRIHIVDGATLDLPKSNSSLPSRNFMAAADLDYDFKVDLVFATEGGIRFYRQTQPRQFEEFTASTKLPAAILHASYTGVWAFDYDLDGDLDLVLGSRTGSPLILRNNGDGTFTPVHIFAGVDGVLDFTSADVDGDGDPDVLMIDGSRRLVAFSNQRLGDFAKRDLSGSSDGDAVALASADVNGDGLPDYVVLKQDGSILALSDEQKGQAWKTAVLTQAGTVNAAPISSLLIADIDNNGALDLIANGRVFLGDGKSFTALSNSTNALYTSTADLDNDGLVDLVGFAIHSDQTLEPATWRTASTKHYFWQTVKPRAARTNGDQRINSFGIGGEIEIRADLLTQQQIILEPRLHFGMGSHRFGAPFARIVWPNGLIQTEFNLKPDQTLIAEQRLKGSCPFLFAWNGQRIAFLKDVAPMAGALGAHDASGEFAGVRQTRQWFSISGEQLKARDGIYDLRVTDEYWETYYTDQYDLLAVDHPIGTSLFVDERVAVPEAPLRWYLTAPPHSFVSARDEHGRDVSKTIAKLDNHYLDTLSTDTYRGVAQDHFVELELPAEAPRSGPVYLIAEGSLRPWDDSTLAAISQGKHSKPRDLSLEVLGADGSWHVAKSSLGVPAGRNKAIVVDLAGLFSNTAHRKLRIRTNLEIYWDRLQWAPGVPDSLAKETEAPLNAADLAHRGYSLIEQANDFAPEIPIYNRLAATGNRWESLEGYYTRYGDVRPLLAKSDGRFVIMDSGDELRLKFQALPDPAEGMVRDFVFIGDGWIKEGDYTFRTSQTVLPLPFPGMRRYTGQSAELEADPVYRTHPDDWRQFHTRYVSGNQLWSGLWQ